MEMRDKNSQIAYFVSFAGHLLLILLLYLFKITWKYEPPEFTEITFVKSYDSKKTAPAAKLLAQQKKMDQEKDVYNSDVVKLPLRRMIEDEDAELKVVDKEKKLPHDVNNVLPASENMNERDENLAENILTDPSMDEKEIADSFLPDEKLIPDNLNRPEASNRAPYEIEGEAAKRTVTFKVIPEYPEGLQAQAIVKIRFSVLPNGHVGEMIPVIKSDARLEKLTLDALRQWRFNPLPENKPQQAETGVITFRYLLR